MTDTPEPFSVSALVRNTFETTGLADPFDLTRKVLELIPFDHRREALAQVLPSFIQREFGHLRIVARQGTDRPRRGSTRAQSTKDWWYDYLTQPLHVQGEWKHLGDCTLEDVRDAAAQRHAAAARSRAIAEQFDAIATAMSERHAMTVAQLPADVVEAIVRPTP